jgi:hypothetical protein
MTTLPAAWRIGNRIGVSRAMAWFETLTTLTHSTVLRVILSEIEG